MSSELLERVRYGHFMRGRLKGQRRSVLVTLRHNDEIYFGISKWNTRRPTNGMPRDLWNKERGLDYARRRAQAALNATIEEKDGKIRRGNITVHEDGTLGHCNVKDVKELLGYFNQVSEYLPSKIEKSETV